jgi:hypothetical protein
MNGLTITSIVLFVVTIITWIVLMILHKAPNRSKNMPKIDKFMTSTFAEGLFKDFPYPGIVLLVTVALLVIAIICVAVGISNTKVNSIDRNSVTVTKPASNFENIKENFGTDTQTYKPIGYGPVLDKVKVKNWLNGNAGSSNLTLTKEQTAWTDGNGQAIAIPTEQFKALYGFIPPSFVYYPKGQASNDYNEINYSSGRQDCMKACSLTNCIAVQTEIPENCSQKTSAAGKGNACGSNSTFSCSLFYDSIQNADDAYWNISNFSSGSGLTNSPGCFETTGSSCLGKKYYEDNSVPTELPNSTLPPSQNAVTFCGPSVTKTNNGGYGIASGSCSCNGPVGQDGCADPNCCVMRPIITTEYIQNKYPYYALPLNVSKASGVTSGNISMVVPSVNYKNGIQTSCGVVNGASANQYNHCSSVHGGGEQCLVSCTENTACASDFDTSNCWKIDPSTCSGDPFDKNTGKSALDTYKQNYQNASPPGSNYDDLYSACYYRQQLTIVQPVQFNCDPAVVTRGCYGSPPIISTDSLSSPTAIAACSDTTVIPDSLRCQQNSSNLAACKDFPYSCGTNNGTNTLWIPQ